MADERAYLYEIIQTIGSGPDLGSILSGVVRLATEATRCHACLVWFTEGDRLVLRACSAPYASLAGTLSVAAGEGLVGWVAKARRSAFIREAALDDPRVRYFPEFEEEEFQSLVSVPVLGRDGDVIGVISLHAEAPHEFIREDLDFLEHTASLIAGATENARLYEESTARVGVLTDLSRLSRKIAAAGAIDEVTSIVCAGTRELFAASVCEMYLLDSDGCLELAAADPARVDEPSLDPRLLQHEGLGIDGPISGPDLARLVWSDPPEGSPLFSILTAGGHHLGLLAVVTAAPPPGAEIALAAIAAHGAVAIRQQELVERLLEKNLVSDVFRALSQREGAKDKAEALATRLEIDLGAPHVIVVAVPWIDTTASSGAIPLTELGDLIGRLETAVAARIPGTLFDRADHSLRILVPLGERDASTVHGELREAVVRADQTQILSVGISDPCAGQRAFPGGFEEAAVAAEVGSLLRGSSGVTAFADLGAYRYVLSPADGRRDIRERHLRCLVEYDRRRGTALLETLERYLDERGNIVGTARVLFIHPNTLRQRLERIERESGLDVEREDWLSLAIAVKAMRLSLLRERATGTR